MPHTNRDLAHTTLLGFGEMGVQRKAHILMVPLGAFGHHYPFVELLHVCALYEDVTVTVVSNKERIAELASLQANGEFQKIDLRLEPLFGPILQGHVDPHRPVRIEHIALQRKKEFEPFANRLIFLQENGFPGVPTCVMSDMFLFFAEELASQLEVPWYSVYVASPPYAALCLEAPKLYKEGLHPHVSSRRHEVLDIPGATFARIRDTSLGNFDFPEYFRLKAEIMRKATGLVFNSAEELDAPAGALEAIRVETEHRAKSAHSQSGPKVFAIGPILNFPGFSFSLNGNRSSSSQEGSSSPPSLEFLSTQPHSSVLYICFGSVANISPGSVTELAHGLEASRVPFLWVLKFRDSLAGAVLPPGFQERIKGRGFIETGWAPQAQILLHSSTGGFLSHCGWNSTLESLCAGVPVVTWPVASDQPLNARFVENVTKSGVSVKKDYTPGDEKILQPSREDVRRAVRLVMVEDEGRELRKEAQKWKAVLTASVAEGGSSYNALRQLMQELLPGSVGKA